MFCDKSINKNIVDIVFKQINKKKKKNQHQDRPDNS